MADANKNSKPSPSKPSSDDLIQFAAQKLGVHVNLRDDGAWYFIGTDEVFDPLTSGDWMLKGMNVCRQEWNIVIWPDVVVISHHNAEHLRHNTEHITAFDPIQVLPRAFWQCWYKVEQKTGGGAHE